MCPYKYYNMIKNSKDKKVIRFKMALHAKEHCNIALTAEFFQTTRDTVYKWLKRYEKHGYSGLVGLSTKPHSSPNTTPKHIKKQVIAAKKKYCRLGAEQVKILADLSVCPETIRKIWREAKFKPRKRVKKHVTKQNLRKEKMKWKLFQQIDVDVKYLDDIPNYYFPMKRYNLPVYQYTARDVTSGLMFWAFSYEYSLSNSVNFINYLNRFLKIHNVDLSKTTIQTDNGSEFIGAWNSKTISAFTRAIHSHEQEHITIPAGAHRYQADVETFHNIEEIEFFDIEKFNNLTNFLRKTYTYQLFFNFIRPNTYKENQSPWDIVQKKNKELSKSICMLKPVILDKMIHLEYTESVDDVLTNPCLFVRVDLCVRPWLRADI